MTTMATRTASPPVDVMAAALAAQSGTDTPLPQISQQWGKHERTVLVIQGGGALGAYQAGVYEGLVENGMAVDWVAGVSIGAINAALIVGNPPGLRVQRLREFWHRMSQFAPFTLPAGFESMRPFMNSMSTASAFMFGVPGFFSPRPVPPSLG